MSDPLDLAVAKMMTETHTDVFLDPAQAMFLLASEQGVDIKCCELFMKDYEWDLDRLYRTAIKNPEAFSRRLPKWKRFKNGTHRYDNVRAWITINFLNMWRRKSTVHKGRSLRFYKTWLQKEMAEVARVEAAEAQKAEGDVTRELEAAEAQKAEDDVTRELEAALA